MFLLLAIVIGVLFASGVYLLLRPSMVRLVFGLALLGHGANLLVFVAGGLVRGNPPLVAADAVVPPAGAAEPVPQALVLTAIVIGFGVIAFTAVLVERVFRRVGTDQVDELKEEEER